MEDQTPPRSTGYEQHGPFNDTQSHQNGVKIHFASSVELLKHIETAWLINKGDGADP